MRTRWPIRNKLLLGLGLLLVIVSSLGWGGIYGLYAHRNLVRSLSRRVPELPRANDLSKSVNELRLALAEAIPRGDLTVAERVPPRAAMRQAREQLAREEFRLRLDAVVRNLDRYREQLTDNPDDFSRITDSRRERETVRKIDLTLARIRAANRDEDWLFDQVQVGQLTAEVSNLQRLAAALPGYLYENVQSFIDQARGQYRRLLVLTWCTSLSAVAMFGLVVRLFYRWIFRPLRTLIEGSRRVAGGRFDYRIRLRTDDEMSELAGAMNDMTARFQAIRDDLDRQVQERTRQVVRSEQLASVGFLAAGVAHEINNPLASIAMCAESLEGRLGEMLAGGGEQQQVVGSYLRMIQEEAFRCKGITEKLLDFSRIGDVQRQHADLGELVRSVIDMIGHLGKYQEKHVELVAGESVLVSVNPQEIKQVILNLVTNGLDSLDPGGTVTVEVAIRNGMAEVVFTDTGCGMTPEVLQHLFEPFFTRRRGGQGTGLGLSIAYRIVEDHEGSIEVHSDGPGHGSWFCVRLPLVARDAATAGNEHEEKQHRYQAA